MRSVGISAQGIEEGGLGFLDKKTFLTPQGGLGPTRAGIDLALPMKNNAEAIFEINPRGLDPSRFSSVKQVTGNINGRAGGGTEMTYTGKIPKSNIKRLK